MKRTLFLVLISSIALEAHALRCNHRIVTVGDYDFEVAERCGEPDYVHTRAGYPYRLLSHHASHRPVIDYLPLAVLVNEWVYDFGSNRLVYLLEFENGRLVRIRTRDRRY